MYKKTMDYHKNIKQTEVKPEKVERRLKQKETSSRTIEEKVL